MVKNGDTVQLLDGQNIAITREGNNITVATKPDVTFNSITAGDKMAVLTLIATSLASVTTAQDKPPYFNQVPSPWVDRTTASASKVTQGKSTA
ncbi:hypothetical protein [Moraxella atlantae]|uniref:hypothetical protein n=1 Tax=Faucicola atlantae TaxID=34059 RepID=UPI0011C05821|nr:hypothetical protein [Moraxella atlantae]